MTIARLGSWLVLAGCCGWVLLAGCADVGEVGGSGPASVQTGQPQVAADEHSANRAKLSRGTELIEFFDIPFMEVLLFFQEVSGIPVHVDGLSSSARQLSRVSDVVTLANGVSLSMPITYSKRDVTCEQFLADVLAMVGGQPPLTYRVERDRIVITPAGQGVFVEEGGLLVVEAEDYHVKIDRSGDTMKQEHGWRKFTDRQGYSGTGFMQVLPDERPESGQGPGSPRNNSGAEMVYRIRVGRAGTYRVWVRGMSMGGESNGVHIGVDGKMEKNGPGSNMSGFRPHNQWMWEHGRKEGAAEPNIELTAGDHTLHVWQRDDAFRLDKLLLGIEQLEAPAGVGPAASRQVQSEAPTTDDERDAAMHAAMEALTVVVRRYAADHNGVLPGLDLEGRFTHQRFVEQLTQRTNAEGLTRGQGPAEDYPCGPYWKGDMPSNPYVADKAVAGTIKGGPRAGLYDDSSGWWLHTGTGRVLPNDKASAPGAK